LQRRRLTASLTAIFLSLLLAFGTVALYHRVHSHPFFNVDDRVYVVENSHVRNGLHWETVKWAFTTFYAYNWHPLTWLSHALDSEIYGTGPAGPHEVNVILHALDAVLLFWVLMRSTGFVGRSFAVAALFAVHPINVEPVVWVAERKTMLSMLFFLAALGAYARYARRPGVLRYSIVAVLYALALMAKPQVITLPLILLLWDYWPLQRMFAVSASSSEYPARSLRALLLEKLPLLILCAASALVTVRAQGMARAQSWGYNLPIRLENAVVSYARYLGNAFWPVGLAPEYPHPGALLPAWRVGGAVALLVSITVLVVIGQRRRYLLVGWLWFLITLVPMIGLIQVGRQAMADRYAYGSFVGLFIMVTWGVADLGLLMCRRGSPHQGHESYPQEFAAPSPSRDLSTMLPALVGVLCLLVLSVLTHRQINYWKDDLTVWRHAASVINNDWIAEAEIGIALQRMGRPEQEFLPHFFKASSIEYSEFFSNSQIAVYYQAHGNPREAIERYRRMLLSPRATHVAADIYQKMGLEYLTLGDRVNAEKCFNDAVNLRLLTKNGRVQ